MNAAKVTLTSTILAAAFGLTLALTAASAEAKPKCDDPPCGGGGGGNVTNPDDFSDVACDNVDVDGGLFNLNGGMCDCLFDVNVGVANGNPVMQISLVGACETDMMLVLPNFLDPTDNNYPSFFSDDCAPDTPKPCPSSDTNTFLDGRDFVLTAVGDFSGDAVITNSTDHGEIVDITIDIMANNAGCDDEDTGEFLESAIDIDLTGAPPIHDPPEHTWIRILGTTVRVTGTNPLCNAIVMQNAPANVRTTTIVHDSTVEPEAYTDVGTLFRHLRFGSDTLGNIGVGSSTIGRPADGFSGTAVEFDDVDMAEIANNTIEIEDEEGDDVLGTGVLVVGSEEFTMEFTIKLNTIKGGDVGIEVGPDADGLITKNTIIGDDISGTVGIRCANPDAITIRKNNTVIGYHDALINC